MSVMAVACCLASRRMREREDENSVARAGWRGQGPVKANYQQPPTQYVRQAGHRRGKWALRRTLLTSHSVMDQDSRAALDQVRPRDEVHQHANSMEDCPVWSTAATVD